MAQHNRRKPRVIHVDKLIIKADEVIVQDEDRRRAGERGEEHNRGREDQVERDPWGFPLRPFGMPQDNRNEEEEHEQKADDDENEKEKDDGDDREEENRQDRRGWWF
ncbi:MAG TPA: hypothetical protein VFK44_00060 [Bacillales bacterium]|nr:hypothetical protein [Bacillales bacterium]